MHKKGREKKLLDFYGVHLCAQLCVYMIYSSY